METVINNIKKDFNVYVLGGTVVVSVSYGCHMKCEMKIEKLCIKILVCLICNPNISLILYSLQFNIDEYLYFV